MIEAALKAGKKVALPRVDPVTRTLRFYAVQSISDLALGTFNIPETDPARSEPVPDTEAELVVVPGVVFDRSGNRLGRGAGFYDRLLAQIKSDTATVALAFAFQVVAAVPVQAHDKKVQKVLTENE